MNFFQSYPPVFYVGLALVVALAAFVMFWSQLHREERAAKPAGMYSQDSRPSLQTLLQGANPQLVSLLYRYVPTVLFGYFGLIALANSFQLSWLVYWIEFWSVPVSVLRGVLPIFDNLGGQLEAMGLPQRVPLIHHLLFAGWSMFVVAFIFCTAAVLRIPPAEWTKIARAYSVWKFAMWAVVFLLFSLLGFFAFWLESGRPEMSRGTGTGMIRNCCGSLLCFT